MERPRHERPGMVSGSAARSGTDKASQREAAESVLCVAFPENGGNRDRF